MKLKFFTIFLLFIFVSHSTLSFSQDKIKPRLSVNYIKDYKDGPTIKALVRYKEERSYLTAQDVRLSLFKQNKPLDGENADEQSENLSFAKVADAKTNLDGEAFFYLDPKTFDNEVQNYEVRLLNHPKFRDKTEAVSFENAVIETSIIENEDKKRSIKVKFKDAKGEPVSRQYLTFRLQRLYGLMQIGDEPYYKTDDNGEIVVDIQQELYSKSGNLDFIIKLDDSDTYGTVIERVTGKFGIVMESKDTYDERTMWASSLKAPWVVLIVPNILLLGIWGTLLFLIINLYKIYKLK